VHLLWYPRDRQGLQELAKITIGREDTSWWRINRDLQGPTDVQAQLRNHPTKVHWLRHRCHRHTLKDKAVYYANSKGTSVSCLPGDLRRTETCIPSTHLCYPPILRCSASPCLCAGASSPYEVYISDSAARTCRGKATKRGRTSASVVNSTIVHRQSVDI